MMRTTVTLEEAVLRDVKKQAAERGISLSELINRALRDALMARAGRPQGRFHMVTYGGAERPVDHSPADLHAGLESDEADAYRNEE